MITLFFDLQIAMGLTAVLFSGYSGAASEPSISATRPAPAAARIGVEEVEREWFEQLRRVDVDALKTYRPLLDPLDQLRRVLRVDGDKVRIRWDRVSRWRVLRPAPTVERAPTRDPVSIEDAESQSLSGLRVVLDPGHRGGAWSRIERRHVVAGPGPAVREGNLTWAVAVQLAAMLRDAGAEVMVTRSAPPRRRFPRALFDGYDPKVEASQWAPELLNGPALRVLRPWSRSYWGRLAMPMMIGYLPTLRPFKLYNRYELRERSRRAEAFKPHVTLSIHFNMAGDPTLNGIIVFLLGNFSYGELGTASQRYYALRALLSGDLDRSRALAQTIGRAMQNEMQLGALSEPSDRPLGLARKLPVEPADGVFARNLAIVRRTPGVALLLEGPCMNAVGEFERLQRKDVELPGGGFAPVRTTQYARAVFRALATHRDTLIRDDEVRAQR
ncbi:MAG: N-acetylmuramoyl-L-alanine amidase [Myxococcota bacterium]